MPHDAPVQEWQEINSTSKKAGLGTFATPKMPYDRFMEEQEIPIYRDIGVSKVQELPMKPWKRMGGKGTFIQLFGTEGLWGSYVIEVPGSGALNAEKHIYEEMYFVVDGRGTTEIWQDGGKKQIFEWQKGSLFSIPMNVNHRIVNAASSPAMLLAGTSAPNAMNLYNNEDFIYNSEFVFSDRYNGEDDYFVPKDDLSPDPVRGLAMKRTNIIPDIIDCELPLDNRRSPGYRRIEPHMAGNRFYLWLGQHETGRYSKAHYHGSAAVLVCVKGKGYTFTWPKTLGTTPWKDGKGDQVKRVDYEPVGMVSAAPMSGDWFHQHFGISQGPLRLSAWMGPNNARGRKPGLPGAKQIDAGAIDLRAGGNAIPYDEEDPFIREEYARMLKANNAESRMEEELYDPTNEKTKAWGAAEF